MADADPNAPDSPAPSSPEEPAKGFTLDLSTGKPPSRRKRKTKGHVAVVQQTINLSTPKPEKPVELATEPKAASPSPRAPKGTSGGRRDERQAPRSGNSLADLLDPETLARLRGGE